MGNDKSILKKITDTMKDIANIAADAANHALKEDEPPRRSNSKATKAQTNKARQGRGA
jgi:hypothetical protein